MSRHNEDERSTKRVYLCDSLVNWKLTPRLRRGLEDRGFVCSPEQFDVEQDETDGWTLHRSRDLDEVENEIKSADVVVCAYPNYTDKGRRLWFEVWTAVEQKKPLVVVRYASKDEQYELRRLLSHGAWIQARHDPSRGVQLAIEAIEMLALPSGLAVVVQAPQSMVLVDARAYWDGLMREVDADPLALHRVAPRRFEEFIAHLLERDGFRVELTPQSRDGGYDIMAYQESRLGSHLFYVECKKWSPDRPVGVEIVRGLYGVMGFQRPTAAAIVTTSRFTKDAIEAAALVPYQFYLHDLDHVRSWARACQDAKVR